MTALRSLPARQREALVLRYYGDLSDAQIAATMGISTGAVRSHAARAMSSLRAAIERDGRMTQRHEAGDGGRFRCQLGHG